MENLWNLQTSPDIAAANPSFAVLPIGSYEQHGSHLPITTDTLIASLIAKGLCNLHGGLLISPITLSCSHEHHAFTASLSISSETLSRVVKETVQSIVRSGIPLTVLINGHGGNYVLSNVTQELNEFSPSVLLGPTRRHWEEAAHCAGIEHSLSDDMHGGEIETSILLHSIPESVRLNKLQDHAASDHHLLTTFGMREYTSNGVIGFPTKASASKGKKLLEKLIELIANDISIVLGRLRK